MPPAVRIEPRSSDRGSVAFVRTVDSDIWCLLARPAPMRACTGRPCCQDTRPRVPYSAAPRGPRRPGSRRSRRRARDGRGPDVLMPVGAQSEETDRPGRACGKEGDLERTPTPVGHLDDLGRGAAAGTDVGAGRVDASHHLGADRGRVLGARVVLGDDEDVCAAAHRRPLAPVAIAAGSDGDDEPAAGAPTRGPGDRGHGVGRVREVDDGGGGSEADSEALHPAGHGDGASEGSTARPGGRPSLRRTSAATAVSTRLCSPGSGDRNGGSPAGPGFRRSTPGERDDPDPRLRGEPAPPRVVDDDDARAGLLAGEQPRLGGKVVLHRPVVVECSRVRLVKATTSKTSPPSRRWSSAWLEHSIVTTSTPSSRIVVSRACRWQASGVVIALGHDSLPARVLTVPMSPVVRPWRRRAASSRWVVVVTPFVPVTPGRARSRAGCPWTAAATGPRTRRGSGTTRTGTPSMARSNRSAPEGSVRTATAPAATASAAWAAPCRRSPGSAKNR